MEPIRKRKQRDCDGIKFTRLPHVVQDSPAFIALGFASRALLLDIARQYSGMNNGKLVICDKALKPRGWNSKDTIYRARSELLEAGFLIETRKGQKPNKASWYALTWLSLDWTPDMDIKREGFTRGAYLKTKTDVRKSD